MPELPEAEAMRARIAPAVEGRRITSLWSGRQDRAGWTARDRRDLMGKRVERAVRHGKLVFLEIEGGAVIVFRLGMSGRLVLRAAEDRHDRAAIGFADGTTLVFSDFRRFGAWRVLRGETPETVAAAGLAPYADEPGFCRSATQDEVRGHGHVLTPGRYVGAADEEDDGVSFEERFGGLRAKLAEQFEAGSRQQDVLMNVLGMISAND